MLTAFAGSGTVEAAEIIAAEPPPTVAGAVNGVYAADVGLMPAINQSIDGQQRRRSGAADRREERIERPAIQYEPGNIQIDERRDSSLQSP